MEHKCKFLKSDYEGARRDCVDKCADEHSCPKKRGRWEITPMCWRIKQ